MTTIPTPLQMNLLEVSQLLNEDPVEIQALYKARELESGTKESEWYEWQQYIRLYDTDWIATHKEDYYPIPNSIKRILIEKHPKIHHRLLIAFTGLPPSVNEIYKTTRGRGIIYLTVAGKEWKAAMIDLFDREKHLQLWAPPASKEFINMHIVYTANSWRFPDPNNMFKLLLDAAETAELFPNDKYVLTHIHEFNVDKTQQTATVILFEY